MAAGAPSGARATGLALSRAPLPPAMGCPWPVIPAQRAEPLPEPLPGPLPEARERPCPVPRLIRRTGLGLVLSTLCHAGMAAAALLILPVASRDEAERGGAPAVTEITLVGEVEALATAEGARAEPVSLALPDLPDVTLEVPEVTPPALSLPGIPPVPDVARVDPEPPAPGLALPEPPSPLPAEIPARTEPRQPHQPTEPAPMHERQAPKLIAPPKRMAGPKPVLRPELGAARPVEGPGRGREGAGREAATRAATNRGGTGGVGVRAGSAVTAGYGARVRALIERQKSYPEAAQDRGQTGRTTIALAIARDGRVASVAVVKGSGHALLDSATLAAVRRAQPFPALPEGGPATISFQLSIGYDLQ